MVKIWQRAHDVLLEMLERMVELRRANKIILLVIMDGILCAVAVWIAFSLRLGVWDLWNSAVAKALGVSLGTWLPVFAIRGVYRSVMRFVGSRTLINIAVSCFLMALVLSAFFVIYPVPGVPRTVGVLQPMTFAALLVTNRLFARYFLFDILNQRSFDGSPSRVLIFGAGSAGRQLALSLAHEPGMVLRGYIDEDARLAGQHLDGVKIYKNQQLDRLVEMLEIDTVLLAVPGVSRQQRMRIVRQFADIPVHVLTLPAVVDLVEGSISTDNLREIGNCLGKSNAAHRVLFGSDFEELRPFGFVSAL